MKTTIRLFLAFLCLTVAKTKTEGLSPPPDGGYPGGNTAEGQAALLSRTTGGFNTAVGYLSLRSDTGGSYNTALGAGALLANTADENTATGAGALLSNTTGQFNAADGAFALFSNTTGNFNTATGLQALFSNTTGYFNTATGLQALFNNTTGHFNTAIGESALGLNTTGSSNTVLGNEAGSSVISANNVICIGANVLGADVSNSCFIGQIFNATSSGGTAVFINSNGRLGTSTSSQRFKEEIKPMERASETLFALRPVSFRYKKDIDPGRTSQFGLVAEDVEKVNPDLVVRDKEGKPYSVRYDQVNAMLLNEFLKEHRKVEEQEKRIDALTAQLKEQAAQIQKVSAQLEASKPASQVVNNNQ
jgi:Chaperone of endosialidase